MRIPKTKKGEEERRGRVEGTRIRDNVSCDQN